MMWGYGMDMGWWMWLWGLLLLVGIALLVIVAVRLFAGGRSHGDPYGPPGPSGSRSGAHQILDERFARGELTAEQYREKLKVLGEDH